MRGAADARLWRVLDGRWRVAEAVAARGRRRGGRSRPWRREAGAVAAGRRVAAAGERGGGRRRELLGDGAASRHQRELLEHRRGVGGRGK